MTPTRRLALIGSSLAALGAIPVALAAIGDTTRLSIHDDDTTQPSDHALGAAVSADGRYVAFTTKAQLTSAATGGKEQLYVRDRQTGATLLASSSATGEAANDDVDSDANLRDPQYAISGDGRYVAFASPATNLITPDGNAAGKDAFRKDLQTGAIVRVNVSSSGAQSGAVGGDPDISYDGSRVVFSTGTATNVFATDANAGVGDIALRDIVAGTTTLVSQNSSGVQANGTTERPAISADGRYVVFQAPNDDPVLIPGDANAGSDVVVRDTIGGTTAVASVATAGTTPGGAGFPDISGDGRYVVFEGPTTYDPANAVAGNNVYRRDLVANTTLLMSSRNALAQGGNAGAVRPAISADGRRAAFESPSTNLTGADTNAAAADIYVREAGVDAATSSTTRASTKTDGSQGPAPSTHAAIAGNGGLAAFTYDAGGVANLTADDTNAKSDVFVKEYAPSDTSGPAIAVSAPTGASARTEAGQVTVTGTVAPDPSGIVEATVGGTRVALGAGGEFSHTVALALGANSVVLTARDGSGNPSTLTHIVERVAPATTPPASRISQLTVLRGLRKIAMRFRLSGRGTVRVDLRRLPKAKLVRTPFTRALRAGRNSIVMPIPRLQRGRYRLTFRVTSPGGTTRVTRTFVVR